MGGGKMALLEVESYSIKFDGRVLERGFWLYVIDIFTTEGRRLYVGRTGDSCRVMQDRLSCALGSIWTVKRMRRVTRWREIFGQWESSRRPARWR